MPQFLLAVKEQQNIFLGPSGERIVTVLLNLPHAIDRLRQQRLDGRMIAIQRKVNVLESRIDDVLRNSTPCDHKLLPEVIARRDRIPVFDQ